MFDVLRERFRRVGPWPRRLVALACLLLAALTAMTPAAAPRAAAGPAATALRPGEVAMPVPVTGSVGELRIGALVGVLASSGDETGFGYRARAPAATLVADRLRVLAVRDDSSALGGDASTVVTVATTRNVAVALASVVTRPLFLIIDGPSRV